MTPKSNESTMEYVPQKEHSVAQNSSSDEAKRLAAAALAAVKDAVASSSGRGKFEVSMSIFTSLYVFYLLCLSAVGFLTKLGILYEI